MLQDRGSLYYSSNAVAVLLLLFVWGAGSAMQPARLERRAIHADGSTFETRLLGVPTASRQRLCKHKNPPVCALLFCAGGCLLLVLFGPCLQGWAAA